MSKEKEGSISLPTTTTTPTTPKRSLSWGKKVVAGVGLSTLLYLSFSAFDGPVPWSIYDDGDALVSTSCHQAEPLLPKFDTSAVVSGKEERIRDWLSGAVKIPTEMFDVMGPIGEDTRWDIFFNFSTCKYPIFV